MSNTTPVEVAPASPQEQINTLYAKKGELVTQLELAQNQLAQVNQQLAQALGITQVQIPR